MSVDLEKISNDLNKNIENSDCHGDFLRDYFGGSEIADVIWKNVKPDKGLETQTIPSFAKVLRELDT